MGKPDKIQSIYGLRPEEHEAFKLYWEGNTVPQIATSMCCSTNEAGQLLDSAKTNVGNRLAERQVRHVQSSLTRLLSDISPNSTDHGSTQKRSTQT